MNDETSNCGEKEDMDLMQTEETSFSNDNNSYSSKGTVKDSAYIYDQQVPQSQHVCLVS